MNEANYKKIVDLTPELLCITDFYGRFKFIKLIKDQALEPNHNHIIGNIPFKYDEVVSLNLCYLWKNILVNFN